MLASQQGNLTIHENFPPLKNLLYSNTFIIAVQVASKAGSCCAHVIEILYTVILYLTELNNVTSIQGVYTSYKHKAYCTKHRKSINQLQQHEQYRDRRLT